MSGSADTFLPLEIPDISHIPDIITKSTYSLGWFNNNHRKNENFKGSEFIGLDFDNGMSIETALETFKEYTHIIGTTKSHQKEKSGVIADRFRVILKLDKEITNYQDYKATATALLTKYPQADVKCSDAARMFYPCVEILSSNFNGLSIPIFYHVAKEVLKTTVSPTVKGTLARSTVDFIAFGAPSSEDKNKISNGRLFKAAVDCFEQGYNQQETVALLVSATKNYGGELSDGDLKTIGSAFNREPKHAPRIKESCFNFKKNSELNEGQEDVKWLVDGFLIQGGLSILAGAPKSGKSTISRQLAVAVAKGQSCLGRSVTKGKVLYLALEEQEGLLMQQFKHIGVTDQDDILLHVGPMNMGNPNDSLKEAIEQYNASLVVIDTLLLYANFENPNDYNEGYKKLSAIRNIARQTGCHIVTLHHQNKGEDRGANSVLGSTAIQGAVDNTIILNTVRGRELYRKITSHQRGGERFINQDLKYVPDMDIYEVHKTVEVDF